MSRSTVGARTDSGLEARVEERTCDRRGCGCRTLDGVGWMELDRDVIAADVIERLGGVSVARYGGILDFCSWTCLHEYAGALVVLESA